MVGAATARAGAGSAPGDHGIAGQIGGRCTRKRVVAAWHCQYSAVRHLSPHAAGANYRARNT
jgi:hypothetical protein